jgi:hypothetical protein
MSFGILLVQKVVLGESHTCMKQKWYLWMTPMKLRSNNLYMHIGWYIQDPQLCKLYFSSEGTLVLSLFLVNT